jgi:L-iditol 2-dehydrogenase
MLTRLSRLAGAGLVVISENQGERRNTALLFGADAAMDPKDGNENILAATYGEGFDYVIDAVGSTATFEQAIAAAARGGTVLVFGVAAASASANIRPFDVYARELTIIGSFINPYTHERAVGLLPQMGLEKLPIQTFSLDQFRDAFAAQSHGGSSKVEILSQA